VSVTDSFESSESDVADGMCRLSVEAERRWFRFCSLRTMSRFSRFSSRLLSSVGTLVIRPT
jgi:hypothetical protein